jgi:hypothetical protein
LWASWLVIVFECAFPLVLWVRPQGAALLLACGLAFHLCNALVLGLNRFLWAWLAGYPALLFWSGQLFD